MTLLGSFMGGGTFEDVAEISNLGQAKNLTTGATASPLSSSDVQNYVTMAIQSGAQVIQAAAQGGGGWSSVANVLNYVEGIGYSTLAAIAPFGTIAAGILTALTELGKWLTAEAPAMAIQFQDQHYTYMTRWLAENVLGIHGQDGTASINSMYTQGWVPFFPLPGGVAVPGGKTLVGGRFCSDSGASLGSWAKGKSGSGDAPFKTADENVKLLALIAGPRSTQLPKCVEISESAFSAWSATPEGKTSVQKGIEIARALAPDGFQKKTLSNGAAFIGKYLVFYNNVRYDINPGSLLQYNVWLSGPIINVLGLPDDTLKLLGAWIYAHAQAGDDVTKRRAVEQLFSWKTGLNDNLFYLLKGQGAFNAGAAVVAELGHRFGDEAATQILSAGPAVLKTTTQAPKTLIRFVPPTTPKAGMLPKIIVKPWYKNSLAWAGIASSMLVLATGSYLLYRKLRKS